METATPVISSKQQDLVRALRKAIPAHCILYQEEDTRPYECDGLAAYRQLPMVVTLPENESQVIAIINICREMQVAIVPRGAGTGLSGGAMPIADGGNPAETFDFQLSYLKAWLGFIGVSDIRSLRVAPT